MALKLSLIIPDTHRPYHHQKAYNLMLDVAYDLKSSVGSGAMEIILLGDYADMYAVNSHGRHPRLMHMLEEEILDVNAGLDQIDTLFPDSKKIYLEGNHEFRLERYLINNAPALFGVTDIQHLFKIPQRPGWTWQPYGPNQAYKPHGSFLNVRHEPLGTSASKSAQKALCSVFYGHIHRIEEAYIVGLNGKQHVNASVGWLGDKRKSEVFGYVKNMHQWQLGFGIVYVDTKTRLFYHQIIPIQDNMTCVVNGKLYRG